MTALHGIASFCCKNLNGNSTMQQMVLARIVRVRVVKEYHRPKPRAAGYAGDDILLWLPSHWLSTSRGGVNHIHGRIASKRQLPAHQRLGFYRA
jgi:hypothetical protein